MTLKELKEQGLVAGLGGKLANGVENEQENGNWIIYKDNKRYATLSNLMGIFRDTDLVDIEYANINKETKGVR